MMPASILLVLHSVDSRTNLIEWFIKNKLCLHRLAINRFELCYDLLFGGNVYQVGFELHTID